MIDVNQREKSVARRPNIQQQSQTPPSPITAIVVVTTVTIRCIAIYWAHISSSKQTQIVCQGRKHKGNFAQKPIIDLLSTEDVNANGQTKTI